jgi:hypothetical protein
MARLAGSLNALSEQDQGDDGSTERGGRTNDEGQV